MPIPSLPLEIINRIIALARDYTHTSYALSAACALMCKSWLPAARRNLYHTLDVGDEGFLDEGGFCSARMRQILGVPSFASIVSTAGLLPFGHYRATPDQGRFVTASNLLVVGVTCVSLVRLVLQDLSPDTLSWLVESCPRPPTTFPRLRTLNIADTRCDSADSWAAIGQLPEGFNDFLAALPTLTSLRIEGFGTDVEVVLPPTCTRFDVQPAALSSDPIAFDAYVPYILRAIGCKSAVAFSTLRHLVLEYPERRPTQAQAIKNILSRCPSLTHLQLDGPMVDSSASSLAELQALDICPSLPSTLEHLSLVTETSDFGAHGILAYLKSVQRSAALRVLRMGVDGLDDEGAIRDVCFKRRIWLNGEVVWE